MTNASQPVTPTAPLVAQPPALAAGAPGATVNPDATNLALRYRYEQLNPQYKGIADRLTALIIAYPDIVKLPDPKQQQDMIARIAESKSGKELEGALHSVGEHGKAAFAWLRKNDPSGLLGAAQSSAGAAQSLGAAAEAASRGGSIAALPVTVPGTAAIEFFNQSKVLLNDLSPEQARSIATSYSSTLQARETDRAEDGTIKTAFSSFGDFWAVVKAGFNTLIDSAAGWPIVGEYVAKWFDAKPERTFAQNLNRAFAEADITVTGAEMAKLGKRNGIDYAAWGSALTTKDGAAVQNRAGQDVPVAGPTADTREPTLPGAPKDASGNPVAASPSATAVLADAGNKAGATAKGKIGEVLGGLSTEAQVGGAVGGTAIFGQGARGAAEGVVKQWNAAPTARAAALEKAANSLHATIKEASAAPKTSAWQFWRASPEKLATMTDELAALKQAAISEGQRGVARAAGAGSFAQGAALEVKGANVLEKLWNVPRHIGRGIGIATGWAGEKFAHLTTRGAIAGTEAVRNLPVVAGEAATATSAAVQAAAQPGSLKSVVAGTAGAWLAPVAIAYEGAVAHATGDDRGKATTATAALTVTAGSLATAALTTALVAGGAIAAAAAAPIVIAGVGLSGLAAVGTSYYRGKQYDAAQATTTTTPQPVAHVAPTGKLPADPALAAAAVKATQRAQAAAQEEARKLSFAGASRATTTTLGSILTPDAGASLAGAHSNAALFPVS